MHSPRIRRQAVSMHHSGLSVSEVSRRTGISRAAIRDWVLNPAKLEKHEAETCVRCSPVPTLPEPQPAYSYLLGLYLGDGHIASARRGVHFLSVFCDNKHPDLIRACSETMEAVFPVSAFLVPRRGCTEVKSASKHWPCVFPSTVPA